jgi:hypothetical protein
VDWRRECLCGEEGVGEFEEGVSAAMEAGVERGSEGTEGVQSRGIRNAKHCAWKSAQRPLPYSTYLKRKLLVLKLERF